MKKRFIQFLLKFVGFERPEKSWVRLSMLLINVFIFSASAISQQNVFSRSEVGTGNWWDGANPWFYASSGNQNRPDNFTRNFVKIGHNNNLTMTTNGAFFQLSSLDFESGASSIRTINSGGVATGISLTIGIFNASGATHILNTDIGIDASTVQIQANGSGGLTFGGTNIFINSNTVEFGGGSDISASNVLSGTNGKVSKVGTGTLSLTGANTYTGLTTVTAGTLQLNRSGGTTIPVTNDVTINGGTLKISTDQTINNLTLSSGTLTVDPGVTLTITGSYSATGGGINNFGTIKLGGGSVSFPGTGITLFNGANGTLTNLEIASSGTVTLNSGFVISGALTLTSGTLALSSNNLGIQGTVNRTAGNINATTGGINIFATGSLSIPASSFVSNTINAMSIVPGAPLTVNFNGDISIGGFYLDPSSTLVIGSYTLSLPIGGTLSGMLTGSPASNLLIGGSAGTLNFTPGGRSLNNLTLTISGSATLGNELDVYGTISLTSASLNLNAQNLTLKSNATGTARIANLTGSTITGATNVTMERFIPQRGGSPTGGRAYRLMASTVNTSGTIQANWMEGGLVSSVGGSSNPLPGYGTHITGSGGNTNNFDVTQNNAPSLYLASNGTINSLNYTPVGSTTTGVGASLNALTGYFLYIRGDRSVSLQVPLGNNMPTTSTTLRTTGSLVTGPVSSFTNGYTGGGAHNLVTNPYPSPIDWSLVQAASTGITDFYTFWDPNFGNRGGFVTVNKTEPGATRYIQSGQAFFVESDNIEPTPVVNILESHKSAVNNNGVFLVDPLPVESFKTELYFTEANGFRRIADRVTAVYDNTYSVAVDSRDAKEISNWDENIAISRDGKRLAIESRPVITKSDDLPIFMNNMKKQKYEFEFTPLVFSNTNLKAELVDHFLGTRTPLSITAPTVVSFTVTADAASSATDRFKVVFGAFGSPTGVDAITIKASQAAGSGVQNNGVQVDWASKTETDMASYEVERSTYGTSFTKVNTTAALGNSTTPVSYNWFDAKPNMGSNFYRVKGIDKAGNVRYSEMVRVLFGQGEPSVVVYPNPVAGKTFTLDLYNLAAGMYALNLYNNDGGLVHTEQWQHDGSQATRSINLKGDLAKGSYQLQLSGNKGFKTSRIIFKH